MFYFFLAAAALTTAPEPAVQLQTFILRGENLPTGLSGLTEDGSGTLWAVPEQERVVVAIKMKGQDAIVQSPYFAIDGIGKSQDTESIAYVGDNLFALGTESRAGDHASDDIFLFKNNGSEFILSEKISLPYSLWKMRATENHGIEGICACDGEIIAGVEERIKSGQGNYAPIGRYSLKKKSWRTYRLALSSDSGKISALSCRRGKNDIEFVAIERHYGVGRILHFRINKNSREGDLQPQVLLDLSPYYDKLPNFEGIAFAKAGGVLLLNDNRNASISGPSMLVLVKNILPN